VSYLDRAIALGLRCLCTDCLAEHGIAVPESKRPLHDPDDGHGWTCTVKLREGQIVKVRTQTLRTAMA
jgi:hypothetical protein